MRNLYKSLKLVFLILIIIFQVACSSDITGIWLLSGSGDAKMQLQQGGSQVVGAAYYQGQYQGQVVGQISGTNIVLQVRSSYGGSIISYTGIISPDGSSMQLRRNDGQIISMFRTG